MKRSTNELNLTITLLLRFLFGGYIAGMDQYLFNDSDSAWTVILIYALMAALFSLYLYGKKSAIKALMYLEAVFLCLNILYSILSISQVIDPGLHDPLADVWLSIIQVIFSMLTLVYCFKINKGITRLD